MYKNLKKVILFKITINFNEIIIKEGVYID